MRGARWGVTRKTRNTNHALVNNNHDLLYPHTKRSVS